MKPIKVGIMNQDEILDELVERVIFAGIKDESKAEAVVRQIWNTGVEYSIVEMKRIHGDCIAWTYRG